MTGRTKKTLKNLGKLALTVLSPPLGLASFAKKNKGIALMAGTVLSLGYALSDTLPKEILYENENKIVQVRSKSRNEFSLKSIPLGAGVLASPLLLRYNLQDVTTFDRGEESFRVAGNEVVYFDEATGNYVLNFDENSKFGGISGKYSLRESQERMSELERELRELASQGELMESREKAEEIEIEKAQHERVLDEYERFRNAYEGVVEEMNEELDGLRLKGEQK
jgi:hypothetical protein